MSRLLLSLVDSRGSALVLRGWAGSEPSLFNFAKNAALLNLFGKAENHRIRRFPFFFNYDYSHIFSIKLVRDIVSAQTQISKPKEGLKEKSLKVLHSLLHFLHDLLKRHSFLG